MKNDKKLIGVAILFCGILPILGGNLFYYLMDKSNIPGYEFSATGIDYILLNASMFFGIFIFYLLIKWRKRRGNYIPAVDERTLLVMKNYFLFACYFIFILSSIILIVLFFLGVQSIEIGAIFAYLACLIVITGVGALIAARV